MDDDDWLNDDQSAGEPSEWTSSPAVPVMEPACQPVAGDETVNGYDLKNTKTRDCCTATIRMPPALYEAIQAAARVSSMSMNLFCTTALARSVQRSP